MSNQNRHRSQSSQRARAHDACDYCLVGALCLRFAARPHAAVQPEGDKHREDGRDIAIDGKYERANADAPGRIISTSWRHLPLLYRRIEIRCMPNRA